MPVSAVAVQESPIPSETVTFPVGVVFAGETGETVKVTLTAWPTLEGLGATLAIAARLAALIAVVVWVAVADV